MAFVKARLDEDEAAAWDAADGDSGRWFTGEKWNVYRAEDTAPDAGTDEHDLVVYGNVKSQSEHIARHDPARVLREVAAGRAILAEHFPEDRGESLPGADCGVCYYTGTPGSPAQWPCLTLRSLAGIWDDHPDYRPEWKP